VLLALGACNGPNVAEAEREWAEKATLQIARVNDVVALQIVTSLAGESTPEGTAPRWVPMHAACVQLHELVPDMRQVASEAPAGYERAGENLHEAADHLESFASQCETATSSEDLKGWYSLEDEMSGAADSVIALRETCPPSAARMMSRTVLKPATFDQSTTAIDGTTAGVWPVLGDVGGDVDDEVVAAAAAAVGA
jgi:hypothetical protein